jgi:hypothetical protein
MHRVFYAILFYFVDYGIPLSQIKIVLFILANRECLGRVVTIDKYGRLMRISEIFLLENLSINVPYHRLTTTV